MRVLLASKDPNLRLALELLLHEEPGMTVVGTASETEGLAALVRTTCPDLVLIDWSLPGRPLNAIFAQIAAIRPPPAVIVLGDQSRDRADAEEAGAHEFVIKGEQPQQLQAALHRVVSTRVPPSD